MQMTMSDWPEPRVRTLEVEELYRFTGQAAGFSYFGALLVLGVLLQIGDTVRGLIWFAWATAITVLRFGIVYAYRRREARSDPEPWARLVIAANFLAGLQWGLLGTFLFPQGPAWAQMFVVMTIICFVSGSVTAYAAVRGAHEALSIPAALPTAVYVFFIRDGVQLLAGAAALFFCFAILYYARRQNRHIVDSYRMQVERDELLDLTAVLNEKLQRENRELAHRAAMRGMSVHTARERAGRLEALFQNSTLPQVECDASGRVVAANLAAERLFGMREGDIIGRPLASFATGAAAETLADPREPKSVPLQVRDGSGHAHTYTANVTPLPAPEGLKPGFAVILSKGPALAELK